VVVAVAVIGSIVVIVVVVAAVVVSHRDTSLCRRRRAGRTSEGRPLPSGPRQVATLSLQVDGRRIG
jgi:hypothetical protein